MFRKQFLLIFQMRVDVFGGHFLKILGFYNKDRERGVHFLSYKAAIFIRLCGNRISLTVTNETIIIPWKYFYFPFITISALFPFNTYYLTNLEHKNE